MSVFVEQVKKPGKTRTQITEEKVGKNFDEI